MSNARLDDLIARVEALEAQQRLGWRPLNTETVYGSEPAVDTVQLHTCSVEPAKPIEEWGKDHTLVEPAVKKSLTTRPGGLVERVEQAVIDAYGSWSLHPPGGFKPEARAAIRAVVAWLRTGRLLHAAELLEQEVDRG
jgi:hypothetical protein